MSVNDSFVSHIDPRLWHKRDINSMSRGNALPQTGTTQYHVLPDKGCAIKEFAVCNSLDLEPWNLLNSLALGYYQPSPEV